MKALTRPHFLVLSLLLAAASGLAQGTAFTYQGRLNQNGTPATGIYDLRFTIYDAGGGGAVVAGPTTQSGVGVTNGLFTATLDFGANVFTGPARWLEIMTRTNGAASFTPLTPRQALTPAPYAIHAGSASDVVNGSVVKSLNNLRDNITLAAGANVTLTPSGNTLTIASTGTGGSNSVWSLNGASAFYNGGNVGVGTSTPARKLTVRTPPTDYGIEHTDGNVRLNTFVSSAGGFLGTVSNHKLHLFVNDAAARLTLDTSGAVGIGTQEPVSRLTVSGAGAFDSPLAAAITLNNTTAGRRWEWHALDDGRMQLADFTASATRMVIDTNGNVGIGTLTPGTSLDVNGILSYQFLGKLDMLQNSTATIRAHDLLLGHTSRLGFPGRALVDNGANGLVVNFGGDWPRTVLGGDVTASANVGVNANLSVGGNVGIGTATPAHKLHIASEGASGYAIGIEGNATQNRDKGGWVKAMAKVNADGTIARQYSAFGGAITVTLVPDSFSGPTYQVDFPFQVNDRFISITPFYNESVGIVAANFKTDGCFGCGPNRIFVMIKSVEDPEARVANEFSIFIF